MQLIWHGHSTWQVRVGDTGFVIDPMFDNPYSTTDPETVDAEYLLLTHGHADHIADVGAFVDRATVVSTPELTGWVSDEFGTDDTIGFNMGGTIECGDAYVTMVPAFHTNGIGMDYGLDAGIPSGVILSETPPDASGVSFYHAGDTSLMSEMRDVIGTHLTPTAAALPIGDHFTMGPRQAAIAVEWLGVDHAFPMHYNTFPPIEQDPEDFVSAVGETASDAAVHVLDAGEAFDLTV